MPLSVYPYLPGFMARNHRSGSGPLVSIIPSKLGPHWDSAWISYCCPVVWRCCSFGSVSQVPSCAGADHRWGDGQDGPSLNTGSGPGQLSWWSTRQFSPVFTTTVSSPALPQLIHPCSGARNWEVFNSDAKRCNLDIEVK